MITTNGSTIVVVTGAREKGDGEANSSGNDVVTTRGECVSNFSSYRQKGTQKQVETSAVLTEIPSICILENAKLLSNRWALSTTFGAGKSSQKGYNHNSTPHISPHSQPHSEQLLTTLGRSPNSEGCTIPSKLPAQPTRDPGTRSPVRQNFGYESW